MEVINKIEKIIKKQIHKGRDFIIFPYGNYGKMVEKCLKKYAIEPRAIVDTYLSKQDFNIKGIEFLETDEARECVLLFTTNKKIVYQQVKNILYKYMINNQLVFIFKKEIIGRVSWKTRMRIKYMDPKGKNAFLLSMIQDNFKRCKTILLDVGCGNDSVIQVKSLINNVYYIGLDIGCYNQSETSIELIDESIIVSPEEFANSIEKVKDVDVIISSHNIEHCYEPEKVILAMIKSLKKNGVMYLAFPSEDTVSLPSRGGCLNFYDDPTHVYLPEYKKILHILQENGMKIIYKKKRYQPFFLYYKGKRNERESQEKNLVMEGTWVYYGFETKIWAKKK